MRSLLILIGCVLLSAAGYCQLRNSTFRLSANYPHIASVTFDPRPTYVSPATTGYVSRWQGIQGVRETYNAKPGVDLSFNVDAISHSKFFVNAGLKLQFYQYKRNIEYLASDDLSLRVLPGITTQPGTGIYQPYPIIIGTAGEPDGTRLIDPNGLPITDPGVLADGATASASRIGQSTVIYLQIPVMIGKLFLKDRMRIQVGVAPSVLLQATQYQAFFESGGGQYRSGVQKNKSSDGFTNLMVNGVFETSYSITKRIGLHVNYQRSFTPIYDEGNRPGGKAVFNSFSLGAGYRVGK